ncbi:MAG: hypothetical protein FJ388_02910 [Verrucomicrobia bacterium]|nr:hypothetical protein [Verrucomicrobiota bacterium]
MNQPIAEFVREALSRGVSRDEITRALGKGGWSAKEIQTALDAFVETELPVPVPRKRVSSSPKEAFFFLVLFSALYTAAFAFGAMLFDLINLTFPQPGETASWWIQSLRFGIAWVVVAFPIFLFMSGLIARETARNPGQKISPIRRWLTYLTLFVAATAIVGDLIALIVTFLEGDLTLRFGLKVAVVAILAGGTFLHYLRDLRRDEMAPSASPERARPGARLAFAGLIGAVVAVVAMGFWFAGSPMRARLLAQDRQRVQDLTAIYWRVENYYRDKGTLPESLAACDISPATFVQQKKDRVTGEPYVYRVMDATHFEVGATFALPSAPDDGGRHRYSSGYWGPGEESFWKHGAGRQTFRIDVARKKR